MLFHKLWLFNTRHSQLIVRCNMSRFFSPLAADNNFVLRQPLRWRHNEPDSVSNHQPCDCLLKRLIRGRPKKTSKLRVTGLCAGNSPLTGEFPAQRASYAGNVSIWWHHHEQNWERHWKGPIRARVCLSVPQSHFGVLAHFLTNYSGYWS